MSINDTYTSRHTAQLALLGATVIWGWTFVIIKESIAEVGTFTFIFYRFSLAAIILALFFWPQLRRVDLQTWKNGVIIGIALFFGYAFQTWGIHFTTASNSAFITGLSVVIVPLLGATLFRERIGLTAWIGVCCSALGLALIILGKDMLGLTINQGDLLTIFGSVAFAFQIVLVSHFSRLDNYIPILVAQISVVAVGGAIGMLSVEGPVWPTSGIVWEGILITSIFATVLALWIQVRFQSQTTAVRTAIIFSAEPVFGALFGYLLLGEKFVNWQWLGAFLIISAMIISQWPEKRIGGEIKPL